MKHPKVILSAVLVLLTFSGCCEPRTDKHKETVITMASAQYKCTEVKTVKYTSVGSCSVPEWILLDVCGIKRYYEWGTWCEDCSSTWRERKPKIETAQIPMLTLGDVRKEPEGKSEVHNRFGLWVVTWKKIPWEEKGLNNEK